VTLTLADRFVSPRYLVTVRGCQIEEGRRGAETTVPTPAGCCCCC